MKGGVWEEKKADKKAPPTIFQGESPEKGCLLPFSEHHDLSAAVDPKGNPSPPANLREKTIP